MGVFDDILKGLPANATLREKNANLEAENAALKTEVAILKDQLHEAKGQITKLEERIKELTHTDLGSNDVQLLRFLTAFSESVQDQTLADVSGLHLEVVRFHLHRLKQAGYVYSGSPHFYRLDQKGRDYLINNKLL